MTSVMLWAAASRRVHQPYELELAVPVDELVVPVDSTALSTPHHALLLVRQALCHRARHGHTAQRSNTQSC